MPDAQTVTLVASTVATITLNAQYNSIEVVNLTGASAVFFTVGGSANPPAVPTVAGSGCMAVGAIADARVQLLGTHYMNGTTSVKLISAGTPQVQVRGW